MNRLKRENFNSKMVDKMLINENDVAAYNPTHYVRTKHVGSNVIIPMSDIYNLYSILKKYQYEGSLIEFIEKEIPNIKSVFQKVDSDEIFQVGFQRKDVECEMFMRNFCTIQQVMYEEIQFCMPYRMQEIKSILGKVYEDLDISKKPTLKDLQILWKLKISSKREYVTILDWKLPKYAA